MRGRDEDLHLFILPRGGTSSPGVLRKGRGRREGVEKGRRRGRNGGEMEEEDQKGLI